VKFEIAESIFSVAAVLAGPVFGIMGYRAWRIRRLLEDTPTSRIRSMAMGLVEVHGTVESRSRTVAPFSGRPCAYWQVEVATGSRGKNGRVSYSTVYHECSGHPFYLVDQEGVALVYPQDALCKLPFGIEEETPGPGQPEPYASYLKEKHMGLRVMWGAGPMRFRERILEDGAGLFVLGRAFPKAMALTVSADDEALEATGTETVGAAHVRSRDADVQGVIRRGPGDPTFVLSPSSEKAMAFDYGLKATAGLLAAPAVTLFGVWCLLELAKAGQLFR
jgi:hypothetical protein